MLKPFETAIGAPSPLRSVSKPATSPAPRKSTDMTTTDAERWLRVKQRLRAEVGDDIFSSWFARMDLDGIEDNVVRLSVPTRFLKSWIQAHYSERVLACWNAERPNVRRIEINVRSAVIRTLSTRPERAPEPSRETRDNGAERADARISTPPAAAAHEALGGSPLDPRLTFDAFVVGRSNTLAHAAAKG